LYDVMDELSAFKGAPAELKAADLRLLGQADVVFTGGVSLYRARLPYAENIHLFPSGVEVDHFARAAHEALPAPSDLAEVPHPIVGYFGVIDERMDLPLLTAMAGAHPDWSIVMLGPVIKIEPDELPQAPNLHFLGMKDYRVLPEYLAKFDVALVPFAMNESTRFLSPTKTLEYMAAEKPVVATPIPDIIELYGDFVRIGATAPEFIAQVEAALAETPAERQERRLRVSKLMGMHTWDHIAEEMDQIIQAAIARRTTRRHGNGVPESVLAQANTAAGESPVNSA
jgi:glycosyltransferase involved in cell wall biosynthesis